jgi:hypothetical protein
VDVLLVLNHQAKKDVRVIVRIDRGGLSRKVEGLLGQNRSRDAFELVKAEGEVKRFIPAGEKLPAQPDLVLIEDLL